MCPLNTTGRNMISFENETHNGFFVIRPEFNRLDSIVAPEFRRYVIELATEKNTLVVLDLINVSFMDSSGLGAVISCYKSTQTSGGVALCNIHDDVKELFTLTHMDRIFNIDDDFDKCLQKHAA